MIDPLIGSCVSDGKARLDINFVGLDVSCLQHSSSWNDVTSK